MEKLNKLSLPATILIASVILGGFYYASEVNKQRLIEAQSASEYKINSNCAEKSLAFSKENTDENETWRVLQNRYDQTTNSCYAEFRHQSFSNRSVREIYDLTHNKSLVFLPDYDEDSATNATDYLQVTKEYNEVKLEVFKKK